MEKSQSTDDGGWDGEREVIGERPSEAVVFAVADVLDCEPVELPPLNRALDPDALNDLFSDTAGGRPRRGGRLAFEYSDCRVVVFGDEIVRVENTD